MATSRRHRALPQSRPARALAAVVAALGAAAGGHLLSTGVAPTLIGLLLAAAAMAAPAWWMARGERGWERLAGAQLTAQLGSHAIFTVAAGSPLEHPPGHLGSDLVLLAHLLAAAVAGGWLHCGERRAVEMSRRAVAALCRLVAALLGERPRAARRPARRRPAAPPALRFPAAQLRHAIVHRGPPAVC